MRSFVRVVSSLWLTIPILFVLASVLIYATFGGGTDFAVGSLKKTVYRSWWFIGLIGLLAVNLITCTVRRRPWKRVWEWGFLLTHAGVLTIMAASVLTLLTKEEGRVIVTEGGETSRLILEEEYEIYMAERGGRSELVRIPLSFDPYEVQEPRVTVGLDRPGNHLRLEKIVPRAKVKEVVRNDRPGESHWVRLVLRHEGRELGRMELFEGEMREFGLGSVRILALFDTYERGARIQEEVLKAVESGQVYLKIKVGEAMERFVPREILGKVRTVGRARVRLKEYRPPTAGRPTAVARFDLIVDGKIHPFEIDSRRPVPLTAEDGRELGIAFLADLRAVHVLLFRTGDRFQVLLVDRMGKVETGAIAVGESRSVELAPGAKVEVAFEKHYDHARARKVVEPVEALAPAAIRFRAQIDGRDIEGWLVQGEPMEVETGGRRLFLGLRPRIRELGFQVRLEDFEFETHPGAPSSPAAFRSTVTIRDPGRGVILQDRRIEVNHPLTYGGYTFYQADYDPKGPPQEGIRYTSVFQVSRDAGKPFLYLGFGLTVVGSIYMFYLKPILRRACVRKGEEVKG